MVRTALVLALVGSLTGCTVINGEELVDHTAVTGSIAVPSPQTAYELSDSRLIRNAVSAADMDRPAENALAWTNADTGATGQITGLEEVREGDSICRTFRTSRQRFDGVALYAGEACTRGGGEWELTRLVEGG